MKKLLSFGVLVCCSCSFVFAVEMPDIDKPVPVKISNEASSQEAVSSSQGLQEINEFDQKKDEMPEPETLKETKQMPHLDVGKHDMVIE